MEFLAVCANIATILSVIWLILYGSKTIFDLVNIKGKRRTKTSRPIISPMLVINFLLTIIILFLSIAFLSAIHYLQPLLTTTSPTLSAKSYGDLESPKLPLSISCNVNCNSKINVLLEDIVLREDLDETIWTFSLTNQDSKFCNLTVNELRLEDINGKNHDGGGQIINIRTLSPGQTLKLDAIFKSTYASLSPYYSGSIKRDKKRGLSKIQ